MDKVEGHCLIKGRLGQLHVGKGNHDSLLLAALIYYSQGPTMKFHIRGERKKKSLNAFILLDFLEIL